MIDNGSDEPITLPVDAYAVVWSPTEGWLLYSPVDPASDTPEPEAVALLGAGVQLEDDAQFRMKCAEALKAVLDEPGAVLPGQASANQVRPTPTKTE